MFYEQRIREVVAAAGEDGQKLSPDVLKTCKVEFKKFLADLPKQIDELLPPHALGAGTSASVDPTLGSAPAFPSKISTAEAHYLVECESLCHMRDNLADAHKDSEREMTLDQWEHA